MTHETTVRDDRDDRHDQPSGGAWLPSWFAHPAHLELRSGFHLRPLRAVDLALDLPAVRGSRESLWVRYGAAWGWPPEDISAEADLADLQRQEQETTDHVSFSYGVLDEAEDVLAGCVYLDQPRDGLPAAGGTADVDVSWWTVDELADSALCAELPEALRAWVAREWPFTAPRFVGVDLGWDEWARLPVRP